MKWFKHDSNALHDAKIEKLIMKYGIEGYGLYFACVEIIASELTPENITFELEHDAEILAHKFKVDTLLVENIMKYCVELGLFEVNNENRIMCLKLAKRLDISTSQNPEIKKLIDNNNYKKLLESNSRLDQKRIDKTRIDIRKDAPFQKPTLDEIKKYLKEKNILSVNASRFWNFYESKGWMVGKNKMRNWHAAVGTWTKDGEGVQKKEEKEEVIVDTFDYSKLKKPKWCGFEDWCSYIKDGSLTEEKCGKGKSERFRCSYYKGEK